MIKEYKNYLRGTELNSMITALAGNDLNSEARTLKLFCDSRNRTDVEIPSEIWNCEGRCTAGVTPPVEATEGDIWFDVLDLTPHILINNAPDFSVATKGWYALHPVFKWQYDTFCKMVDYKSHYRYGVLSANGSSKEFSEKKYLANVIQMEANAYARWFGKDLEADGLANVVKSKFSFLVDSMLPAGFALWNGAKYTSGFTFATSREQLDMDPDDENFDKESAYSRFSESAAADNVGLLVFVPYSSGLSQAKPPIKLDEGMLILNNKPSRTDFHKNM